MQLLCTDGYLRAQPELTAVVEARAGVHKYGRRVDLVDKASRVLPIVGQDAVGMVGAVFVDVRDGFVQTVPPPARPGSAPSTPYRNHPDLLLSTISPVVALL